jgi:hypothetical protein
LDFANAVHLVVFAKRQDDVRSGDVMGGHGFIAPVFVCAVPSGQNSIVVTVVNVTSADSERSGPSLFGRVIGLLSGAGNG